MDNPVDNDRKFFATDLELNAKNDISEPLFTTKILFSDNCKYT